MVKHFSFSRPLPQGVRRTRADHKKHTTKKASQLHCVLVAVLLLAKLCHVLPNFCAFGTFTALLAVANSGRLLLLAEMLWPKLGRSYSGIQGCTQNHACNQWGTSQSHRHVSTSHDSATTSNNTSPPRHNHSIMVLVCRATHLFRLRNLDKPLCRAAGIGVAGLSSDRFVIRIARFGSFLRAEQASSIRCCWHP